MISEVLALFAASAAAPAPTATPLPKLPVFAADDCASANSRAKVLTSPFADGTYEEHLEDYVNARAQGTLGRLDHTDISAEQRRAILDATLMSPEFASTTNENARRDAALKPHFKTLESDPSDAEACRAIVHISGEIHTMLLSVAAQWDRLALTIDREITRTEEND
ncbi:hypothetical protein [Novosphingobium sp. BW1]|uniref:hypothetical protein n=1 Tax=Novosphingobium sp. BW1 TaxID=2592621 RepID=UPI0011DE61F5|nr:hypothetical protein [Novosphingobium sp. BW1]TYC92916.1 hypothetical protein FMM79_02620 [Novosphingobium sp. BW1]